MTLIAEPKIDGLSLNIRYAMGGGGGGGGSGGGGGGGGGSLVQAATRGDGRQGDDVTAVARRITDIPQQIGS